MTPLVLALALAVGQPVEVSFQGPLREAIRLIAKEGGLNVVVAAELDEPVQVDLHDVDAQAALESLGKVYGLSVQNEGTLWVVRRQAAAPRVAEPSATPTPVEPVVEKAPTPPSSLGRQGDLVSTGQPVVVRAGERVDTAIGYGGSVVLEPGAEVTGDAVSFGADVVGATRPWCAETPSLSAVRWSKKAPAACWAKRWPWGAPHWVRSWRRKR